MASSSQKRGAGRELNHDNWDEPEEPEQAGVWSKAGSSVLQNRQIKRAKRTSSTVNAQAGGLFGSIKLVGSPVASTTSICTGSPNIGYTQNTQATSKISTTTSSAAGKEIDPPTKNGGKSGLPPFSTATPAANFWDSAPTTSKDTQSEAPVFNNPLASKPVQINKIQKNDASDEMNPGQNINFSTPVAATNDNKKERLTRLNKQFRESINGMLDENPTYNLSHTCVWYQKYAKTIQQESTSTFYDVEPNIVCKLERKGDSQVQSRKDGLKEFPANVAEKPFSFGAQKPEGKIGVSATAQTSAETKTTSSNAQPSSTSKPFEFKPFASQGMGKSTDASTAASSTGGFKFNSTGGFKFGGTGIASPILSLASSASAPLASTEEDSQAKDEEDAPPVVEVSTVTEDDAMYTVRIKLFYKKDSGYKEKGVGNVHLKRTDGKPQLIVRADTNLGNILLNIHLSDSLPVFRLGKNNVAIVCVPNPPLDPKKPEESDVPTTMLLRVNTSGMADELLEEINKLKKDV